MNARVILFSTFVLLSAAAEASAGGVIASPPLRLGDLHDYECGVVNAGTKELASVTVKVWISGGGNGTSQTCEPLAPNTVCAANNTAGSAGWRYCEVTALGSGKALRGQFCNRTTGDCVPLR